MARLPRYYLPNHPQHIIVRGNNGCDIFKQPADYDYYLLQLGKACSKHGCQLHAYALMSNHVHLLMTPQREPSIGKAMQMIGRYYVQYFNQSYQRSGTLWEGRYKATLVDADQYLITLQRYIELNPVRSGLATNPADYRWTSYGSNALGRTNTSISPAQQYLALGDSPAVRQSSYRALFESDLPEQTINHIREATNKAWVLGDTEFKETIADIVNRRTEPKPRGGDRRSQAFRAARQTDAAPGAMQQASH